MDVFALRRQVVCPDTARGRTYFFIAVNITEQQFPISEKDKGKPVKTNSVKLDELLDQTLKE